ncbi:hypothetical protein CGRA01v4_06807 [Colletotrichum graminicola]|nr:hypothetical protein CGRA01v4_06807 [Colletotrichum graminicola]
MQTRGGDASGSCPSFTKPNCVLSRNLMHWSCELAALQMTRSSQPRDRRWTWHSPESALTEILVICTKSTPINKDKGRPTRGFIPGEGGSTFERSRTRYNLSTGLLLNYMVWHSGPVLSLG